jgi:hypothetical protein
MRGVHWQCAARPLARAEGTTLRPSLTLLHVLAPGQEVGAPWSDSSRTLAPSIAGGARAPVALAVRITCPNSPPVRSPIGFSDVPDAGIPDVSDVSDGHFGRLSLGQFDVAPDGSAHPLALDQAAHDLRATLP